MKDILEALIYRTEEYVIKHIELNLLGKGESCWEALERNFETCVECRLSIDSKSQHTNSSEILKLHDCEKDTVLKYEYEVLHHDEDPKRCPGW
ncbi:hypothetical protein RJI07_01695 [Mycoplasmatota bacterium WC30]